MGRTMRVLLILLFLAPVSFLSLAEMRASRNTPGFNRFDANRLPLILGGFKGRDLPVDWRTLALLETKDVLLRSYREGEEPPVTLCAVFSEHSRMAIHPPEVCYRGGGWEVLEKRSLSLFPEGGRRVVRLVIQHGEEQRVVYYWYLVGKAWAVSFYMQQLEMAWNRLKGRFCRGALMRLSTPLGEGSEGEERLKRFSRHLVPAMERCMEWDSSGGSGRRE